LETLLEEAGILSRFQRMYVPETGGSILR